MRDKVKDIDFQQMFGSTAATSNLQEHYTVAEDILDVMASLLGIVTDKTILEPACGEGAFISCLQGIAKRVDVVDVNSRALEKIEPDNQTAINRINADFLDAFVRDVGIGLDPDGYDMAIANPPYGLKLSQEYRKEIKIRYPFLYGRESYSLFLCFTLMKLRRGGRYVFIIPDTFLHSYYHRPTRRFILEHGAPTHILQFKSSRFKTVNFGYANLCIVAGNAEPTKASDEIIWLDATKKVEPLLQLLREGVTCSRVSGVSLSGRVEEGWIHPNSAGCLEVATLSLGDVAECKTGIYTGDNKNYLGFNQATGPIRGTGHPIVWEREVLLRPLSREEKVHGIENSPFYVPIVKGGHRAPLEETRWAIKWSPEALKHYKTDSKARFQNSDFYFRSGLAIPMVTSGRVSASYFENSVFDQGVVGVFPKKSEYLAFLLIYLNSKDLSKILKKSVSASANLSANYVKKIPIPLVEESDLREANRIFAESKANGWESTEQERMTFLAPFLAQILPT